MCNEHTYIESCAAWSLAFVHFLAVSIAAVIWSVADGDRVLISLDRLDLGRSVATGAGINVIVTTLFLCASVVCISSVPDKTIPTTLEIHFPFARMRNPCIKLHCMEKELPLKPYLAEPGQKALFHGDTDVYEIMKWEYT